MKFINRWGLMRSLRVENAAEHSFNVALIAHALGVIDKIILGRKTDPDKAAAAALYHETAEVLTGDLPAPIKYFNKDITSAYKSIEHGAEDKLLNTLPESLKAEIASYVRPSGREAQIVKAADKLAAYIKCIEEHAENNSEFSAAVKATERQVKELKDPAVDYFLENFIKAYFLNLDELSKNL